MKKSIHLYPDLQGIMFCQSTLRFTAFVNWLNTMSTNKRDLLAMPLLVNFNTNEGEELIEVYKKKIPKFLKLNAENLLELQLAYMRHGLASFEIIIESDENESRYYKHSDFTMVSYETKKMLGENNSILLRFYVSTL